MERWQSVTVDWTAPAFGVVQYYTVYRGCNPNGSDGVSIGVVNGVGGAAPATEFIDSNPVTCSGSSTVVYTIATTLAPVPIDQTQRSSAPSVPAIVKNIQTIVLGPLQSSVTYSTPPPPVTVTATAETNGSPNGLQVNFVATGPCSVSGQSVASIASGGVSTATVAVNDPGSNPATCTVTASQAGTNPTSSSTPPYYDAGEFSIWIVHDRAGGFHREGADDQLADSAECAVWQHVHIERDRRNQWRCGWIAGDIQRVWSLHNERRHYRSGPLHYYGFAGGRQHS